MSDFVNQQLSTEEIDVMLAALRLLQRTSSYDIPDSIQEIGGHSLKTVNIDRLCERLNLDGIAQKQDERDTTLLRIRAELSRPEWNSDTAANLAATLADVGRAPILGLSEGWYFDVVDGKYTVTASEDGPYHSDAAAVAAIAKEATMGSRWHQQVLAMTGLTACGHGKPLMKIKGFGPNGIDVVVANEQHPECFFEVGFRPGPFSDDVWSIFRRDGVSGELRHVTDRDNQRKALAYCAEELGVTLTEEHMVSFSTYF